MPQPITMIGASDRAQASHARAVRCASDEAVESWDLELWGDRPERLLASDSYSLNAPVTRESVLDLLSYVLTSSGLQLGRSELRNSASNEHDFRIPVSPIV